MSTFKGSLQYHLPYTTVERWFYRYVPEQLPDQTATRVCVDEFALRKGHHYATSVLNTDTGHVLAVVPHRDRDQDAMETALSLANGNVKAVVSDLAPAIAKAVGAVFPDAIHVLDRFHIIQFFTDALKIRRRYLNAVPVTCREGDRWIFELSLPPHCPVCLVCFGRTTKVSSIQTEAMDPWLYSYNRSILY